MGAHPWTNIQKLEVGIEIPHELHGGREGSQKRGPNPIGRGGSGGAYLGMHQERKLSQRCHKSCMTAEDQAQKQSSSVPPSLHPSLCVGHI